MFRFEMGENVCRGLGAAMRGKRLLAATICLVICAVSPAMAQYGVTTSRDQSGNIVRNSGAINARAVNEGPVNKLQDANRAPSNSAKTGVTKTGSK